MQQPLSGTEPPSRKTVLLLDSNAERRSLRQKVLGLHGIEVIGASDLAEASSIWERDRYDLVLMDIRRDYHGCLARRDEIKKENPKQLVAFLVGQPEYVNLEPDLNSYVAEEPGAEWSDSFRRAVLQACTSLPQRNGFEEVGFRIAAARKVRGLPRRTVRAVLPSDDSPDEVTYDPSDDSGGSSTTAAATTGVP
jgi:CheY-like chemotaxis protein